MVSGADIELRVVRTGNITIEKSGDVLARIVEYHFQLFGVLKVELGRTGGRTSEMVESPIFIPVLTCLTPCIEVV